MKKTVKLVLSMLAGFLIGMTGVAIFLVLFSDMTWARFWEKFLAIEFFPFLGKAALSMMVFVWAGYLQIILHEGGHLLLGLASGFRFVSFRIGSLTLIRQNGRFRVKQFAVAGTGGQCLLSPPDTGITPPAFTLYNIGGVLMNLLTALAVIPLWTALAPLSSTLRVFLIFFAATGFLLALTNGIPMRLASIGNDGYNILNVRKDKRSMQSLEMQFRVNALAQEGVRLKDMPAEWFPDEPVTDYRDIIQVGQRIFLAARYADNGEYDKARLLYDDLLEHSQEIIGLYLKEITCEVLLLELMGERRKEVIEKLYTPDIQAYIGRYMKVMSGKQVLACALALHWEQQPEKAVQLYEQLVRHKEKYLMQGEVATSLELMEGLLEGHLKND